MIKKLISVVFIVFIYLLFVPFVMAGWSGSGSTSKSQSIILNWYNPSDRPPCDPSNCPAQNDPDFNPNLDADYNISLNYTGTTTINNNSTIENGSAFTFTLNKTGTLVQTGGWGDTPVVVFSAPSFTIPAKYTNGSTAL